MSDFKAPPQTMRILIYFVIGPPPTTKSFLGPWSAVVQRKLVCSGRSVEYGNENKVGVVT